MLERTWNAFQKRPVPDVLRRTPPQCRQLQHRAASQQPRPHAGIMEDVNEPETILRARKLHDRSVTIDACSPILRDLEHAHYWRRGGLTCGFATMALPGDDLQSTVLRIAGWMRQARAHAQDVVQAFTTNDIRRAKDDGKLAVVLALQTASPLEGELDMVEAFHRLGVRALVLAYNRAELAGDGCLEPRNGGLTRFGRHLIAEMNRVGMLLDLSHCGVRTSLEAIDVSEQPVALTHVGAKAVFDHPRNVSDEQLRAVASRGGVVGINSLPAFIDGTGRATLSQMVDHLEHVVDVIGINHVGLGFDFSQPPGTGGIPAARYERLIEQGVWTRETLPPPPWTYPLESPAEVPRLSEELLLRGYDDEDVEKVLGGNFLRLFDEVWRSA